MSKKTQYFALWWREEKRK